MDSVRAAHSGTMDSYGVGGGRRFQEIARVSITWPLVSHVGPARAAVTTISRSPAFTESLDVIGAYYHYNQQQYVSGVGICANTGAHGQCAGTQDMWSAVADWASPRGDVFGWSPQRFGEWRSNRRDEHPLVSNPPVAMSHAFRVQVGGPGPRSDKQLVAWSGA